MIAARTKPLMQGSATPRTGRLIINADDWGRDREVTDRTLDCILCGSLSSVSAMVFMTDSERAADIARQRGIDAGLHLNFTTPFSTPGTRSRLLDHHNRVAGYLRGSRLAQAVFHPGLVPSFEYLVAAQLDEFGRLYGKAPGRLDGHHHMHLCANVVLARLLPPSTIVRRNFSFQAGEKSIGNRIYRSVIDRILARRHRLTDFFFSLEPLAPPERLQRIFDLSRRFVVEVENHACEPAEYLFLTHGGIRELVGDCPIAPRFEIGWSGKAQR